LGNSGRLERGGFFGIGIYHLHESIIIENVDLIEKGIEVIGSLGSRMKCNGEEVL
jgi:hypothetical protein